MLVENCPNRGNVSGGHVTHGDVSENRVAAPAIDRFGVRRGPSDLFDESPQHQFAIK
jgi:hypothetical protein